MRMNNVLSKTWWILFPITFVSACRIVYEKSYLTWESGPQMIGSSVMHQYPFLTILGIISILLSHIWFVVSIAVIFNTLPENRVKTGNNIKIIFMGVSLLLFHVPEHTWGSLLSTMIKR